MKKEIEILKYCLLEYENAINRGWYTGTTSVGICYCYESVSSKQLSKTTYDLIQSYNDRYPDARTNGWSHIIPIPCREDHPEFVLAVLIYRYWVLFETIEYFESLN